MPLTDQLACSKPNLVKLDIGGRLPAQGNRWYETDFKTGKKESGQL